MKQRRGMKLSVFSANFFKLIKTDDYTIVTSVSLRHERLEMKFCYGYDQVKVRVACYG
jgi:hypothetical protein